VLSSGGLQLLDVLLGHVDQEGQVGGVSPQADCQGHAWSANGRIA
jgi:hypothetical protein